MSFGSRIYEVPLQVDMENLLHNLKTIGVDEDRIDSIVDYLYEVSPLP